VNRSDIIRELTREYEIRRRVNEEEWALRLERAGQLDPAIPQLITTNTSALFAQVKSLLLTSEGADASIEALKNGAASRRAEMKKRLLAVSLPEDYLEPICTCSLCRDTGYVGEEIQRRCTCFERALQARTFNASSLPGLDAQCFEAFDETVFPDEMSGEPPSSQRSRMTVICNYCRRYADAFPNSEKYSIVLTGESGLGKTFLLNCIAARVLSLGHEALRLTAYQMFAAMRASYLGEEGGERRFRELCDVPLLLIDDIGTEPMNKNITIEYFFILLNERQANRRNTVIATNFAVKDLQAHYGERVISRLLNRESTQVIQLTGRDLRLRN